MKKKFVLASALAASSLCFGQPMQETVPDGGVVGTGLMMPGGDDPCPKPTPNVFNRLCLIVERKDIYYESTIKEMACVSSTDDDKTRIAKVQRMWEAYKLDCQCNTEGLNAKNGSPIKMAIAANFMEFVDGLVKDYELDINFIDKTDGRNALDFAKDEIARIRKVGGQAHWLSELEKNYAYMQTELGAKHSPAYLAR